MVHRCAIQRALRPIARMGAGIETFGPGGAVVLDRRSWCGDRAPGNAGIPAEPKDPATMRPLGRGAQSTRFNTVREACDRTAVENRPRHGVRPSAPRAPSRVDEHRVRPPVPPMLGLAASRRRCRGCRTDPIGRSPQGRRIGDRVTRGVVPPVVLRDRVAWIPGGRTWQVRRPHRGLTPGLQRPGRASGRGQALGVFGFFGFGGRFGVLSPNGSPPTASLAP